MARARALASHEQASYSEDGRHPPPVSCTGLCREATHPAYRCMRKGMKWGEKYPRWRVWPLAPGTFLFPDHELTWCPGSWKVMCRGLVWNSSQTRGPRIKRGWTIVLTLNHTNYRRSLVVVIFAYLATAPEPQLPRIKRGMGGASRWTISSLNGESPHYKTGC